jgi:hypothetical protein
MNEIILTKKNATRVRWDRAIKDKAFDLLRDRPLLETCAEHFLARPTHNDTNAT